MLFVGILALPLRATLCRATPWSSVWLTSVATHSENATASVLRTVDASAPAPSCTSNRPVVESLRKFWIASVRRGSIVQRGRMATFCHVARPFVAAVEPTIAVSSPKSISNLRVVY
jgi:hypothetical protein